MKDQEDYEKIYDYAVMYAKKVDDKVDLGDETKRHMVES